eukprot:7619403-Pyramimonas_sp.AAC.1
MLGRSGPAQEAVAICADIGSYSGDPCQETPYLPSGYPGFLRFRRSCCGERDVPTSKAKHP